MLEGPAIHAGVIPPKTKRQRVLEIIAEEAAAAGVPVAELLTPGQGKKAVVRARSIAMYRARKETELSYPQLGQIFHRGHATVLMAARRIATERGESITAFVKSVEIWTTEKLAAEAAKHSSRTEFFLSNPGAYATARKRGLLDAICPPKKTPGRKARR